MRGIRWITKKWIKDAEIEKERAEMFEESDLSQYFAIVRRLDGGQKISTDYSFSTTRTTQLETEIEMHKPEQIREIQGTQAAMLGALDNIISTPTHDGLSLD